MRIIKTDVAGEADVSIIIPVYNEEKYLPYALASIRDQKTDLVGEIVVIDDGSTDGTVRLAESFGCTVMANEEKLGVNAMRNLGHDRSHGKTILHFDADAAISDTYVEKMVRPILEGRVEATLCSWFEPLEAKYDVLPDVYSASYAWLLRHVPDVLWGKTPVRVLIWFGNWFRTMWRKKRIVSLLTIPDRVQTCAIVVLRQVPERFGGWRKPFGAQADTDFTRRVFAHTGSVRWILGCTLFHSCRRHFPTDETWLWRRLFPRKDADAETRRNLLGYDDPKGRR